MNARLGSGIVLALALLLASPAFAQTIRITAPTNLSHIDLGYDNGGTADPNFDDDTAITTRDVTFTFTVTTASGADRIHLVVDGGAPITVTLPPSGAITALVEDVEAGAHTVAAYLANGADQRYQDAVSVIRFYLAQVCEEDVDCLDDDPCTQAVCNGAVPNTGGFHGGCRFGPVTNDPDCCAAPEWCRYRGLTLSAFELDYQCTDVDSDSVGDCVQCTNVTHCQAVIDADLADDGRTCLTAPQCVDNVCEFDRIPNCCLPETQAADCNDDNSCTIDTCDGDTQACSNTPVPSCCIQGNEDLQAGAPDFGCITGAADPCRIFTCLPDGSGNLATATCRQGPRFPGCCDANNDCSDPTRLNACTNADGDGMGVCDLSAGSPGTCTYPKVDPECCIRNYECSGQYPEFIGECVDNAPEAWKICEYEANPDFCETPVASLMVNELMINPGGTPPNVVADFYGEWIEVFNPTSTEINLEGWQVEDLGVGPAKQAFTITSEGGYFPVPAGGFRLLVRSNDPRSNGGLRRGYPWPTADFQLDNSTDAVVLRDPAGTVRDTVAYQPGWPIVEGASMALINPYLDNSLPESWGISKTVYGDPIYDNKGTPQLVNADVFDEDVTAGLTCDDADPCTVDICNLDKADICSHRRLADCCTTATAATACNDLNACTIDSCNTATNACVHALSADCCVADSDCVDWYPATVTEQEQRAAFDLCAVKTCIANTCRYGRNTARPGCCVSATHADFGCADRNICTIDACVEDAGQDPQGVGYDQCDYSLDLDDDDINDCCRVFADCDDSDPSTMDICDMQDDGQGPGVNRCWYRPDPNYCGPGGNLTCDDGNVCTTDVCGGDFRCTHTDVPNCCVGNAQCVDGLACTTDTCVNGACQHTEVSAGCCETHADCNGPDKPASMYCRTGYCIGRVCRYGPAIAGCCVTPDDCQPTTCTSYECTNHTCQAQQVANCCITGSDCPAATDACKANICSRNQCTLIDLPNCCEDTNPQGPDSDCDDSNPCTSDFCVQGGGGLQCRYFPVGGAGCCSDVEMCPDDQVQCTALACSTDNACQLEPVPNCLATSAYRMTFTEGHSVYSGEYSSLADLSWSSQELGQNSAAAAWGLATTGTLGPDRYLSFEPLVSVSNFDSCAVLPRFDTRQFDAVSFGLDWAAQHVSGSVTLRVLGRVGGGWNTATPLWTTTISANVQPAHVNAELPEALLGSDQTQLAICISGASTSAITEVLIDQVVLSQGHAPEFAAIPAQSAAKGQTKTITAAFTVTDLDTDEAITFSLVNPPGSWIKVVNPRKLPGDGTQWTADVQITGAVCPASAPYNHSVRVKASDGALETEIQSFVLAMSGCP